jgi:hypothetical protein
MMLQEDEIPVRDTIRGVCKILCLDPLYIANDGKPLAIVAHELAPSILTRMRSHPLGGDTRIVGQILEAPPGMVLMKTSIGGTRVVDNSLRRATATYLLTRTHSSLLGGVPSPMHPLSSAEALSVSFPSTTTRRNAHLQREISRERVRTLLVVSPDKKP